MRQTAMNAVYALAKRNDRVVFVGSDLGSGTLDNMKAEFPDRFFMEGVSEAHIIGMSAGLAMNGFIPYVNTIATFITRRCYEQVAVDLCLHNLPVRLIGSGGGIVYAPLGPTHMAVEDIAIFRALPNMTIVAPSDAEEMQRLIDASVDVPGPLYIRVAKGGDPVISKAEHGFRIGKAIHMRTGTDIAFISTGVMTGRALAVAHELAKDGLSCSVLHVHTIKPLDSEHIAEAALAVKRVVTIEEHTRIGGLGSAVLEALSDRGVARPVLRLGLPDHFISEYGSQDSILASVGLDVKGILDAIRLHR